MVKIQYDHHADNSAFQLFLIFFYFFYNASFLFVVLIPRHYVFFPPRLTIQHLYYILCLALRLNVPPGSNEIIPFISDGSVLLQ